MSAAARVKILIAFMCVAMVVYFLILGKMGIALVQTGKAAAIGMGVGVLILPFIGLWAMIATLRAGFAHQRLAALAAQQGREQLHMVINQVNRAGEGRTICQQLQQVVERFVLTPSGTSPKLNYFGGIPLDVSVRGAGQRRSLLLELHPGCPASQGVVQIATKLNNRG